MVQPRRLAFQRRHKVQRGNERFVPAVSAPMFGHDLAAVHDLHAVDVSLDRHLRKGRSVRHAITVSLEYRRLVFVHQAGSLDAGVEAVRGDWQRLRLLQLEVRADSRRLMPNRAIAFAHAERQELAVQIRQIPGPGYRRAGPAFQREHRTLHVAFFLPSGRHAEQRVEPVV